MGIRITSRTDKLASGLESASESGFLWTSVLDSIVKVSPSVTIGPFTEIELVHASLIIEPEVTIGMGCSVRCLGSRKKPITVRIGRGTRIGSHTTIHASANLSLGQRCHLWDYSYLAPFSSPFELGNQVTLGQHTLVAGRGPLGIGNRSMVGGQSSIITEQHNYERLSETVRDQGMRAKGIYIGRDVWIGGSCVMLDGVRIANHVIVGADSLVTRSLTSAGGVYVGRPATFWKARKG